MPSKQRLPSNTISWLRAPSNSISFKGFGGWLVRNNRLNEIPADEMGLVKTFQKFELIALSSLKKKTIQDHILSSCPCAQSTIGKTEIA